MNFVLHLHLAARDLGSDVAGVGAMLPDLWRMADRRVRARRDPTPVAGHDPALGEVLRGVAHHLQADAWFHGDAVFADGEKEAAALLSSVRAPRSVLLAHVLWELCLDGALVRREGLASVLGRLRAGLAGISPEVAAGAAAAHHFDRVERAAHDRARFEARLDRILTELARGPWIDGYQTGEGVADRLEGVRRAVGLAPMDELDSERVGGIAERLLARAPAAILRIESAVLASPSRAS